MIDKNNAKRIGKELSINWNDIDLGEFTRGRNVEFEHESGDSHNNITDNYGKLNGQLAWAQIKELPDY